MIRWVGFIALVCGVGLLVLALGHEPPMVSPPPSPSPPSTPTPTPMPSVRVIYAIPSDRAYDARYDQAIGEAVLGVQSWFGERLDGITFATTGLLPQVCELAEPGAEFTGDDGFHRVIDSIQHCAPVAGFSEWYTWVIYVDVDYPCENRASFKLGAGEQRHL